MTFPELEQEVKRLRAVNERMIFALEVALIVAREALDNAKTADGWAWCPKCEQIQPTQNDGETCARCHTVL